MVYTVLYKRFLFVANGFRGQLDKFHIVLSSAKFVICGIFNLANNNGQNLSSCDSEKIYPYKSEKIVQVEKQHDFNHCSSKILA